MLPVCEWAVVTRRVGNSASTIHRAARETERGRRRSPAAAMARSADCANLDDSVRDDTSRQPNTHITEWREVCYPWHPWFGRAVAVYERLVKRGQSLCRCGLEEERNCRAVEIPTWMIEPAACCRLRMMAVPTVSCDALLELKALLHTARPDPGVVLQAQHRPLLAAGGADAMVHQSTATLATHPVPSALPTSIASDIPAGDPREDHQRAGRIAPRVRQPRGRRRRRGRGGAR
jgi:hypothetical protein